MLTSILLLNKSNIVTYRNSTNNRNKDKDSNNDSDGVNKDNSTKMI